MSQLIWSNEYSIGVPDIDHEHRQLIEFINRLYKKLGENGSEMTVEDFLNEVYKIMSAHFTHEEKMMREHNYAHYADHKSDHALLLDEIKELMFDFRETSEFDKDVLNEHLERWFTIHFRTKDAHLHKILN
ncbi:bacteriohemerythrin [Pseudomonadota bacterium]